MQTDSSGLVHTSARFPDTASTNLRFPHANAHRRPLDLPAHQALAQPDPGSVTEPPASQAHALAGPASRSSMKAGWHLLVSLLSRCLPSGPSPKGGWHLLGLFWAVGRLLGRAGIRKLGGIGFPVMTGASGDRYRTGEAPRLGGFPASRWLVQRSAEARARPKAGSTLAGQVRTEQALPNHARDGMGTNAGGTP